VPNNHSLLPLPLLIELYTHLKLGKVIIALFEIVIREPPVVCSKEEVIAVVVQAGQVLDDLGPDPISWNEGARSIDTLRRTNRSLSVRTARIIVVVPHNLFLKNPRASSEVLQLSSPVLTIPGTIITGNSA